MRRFAALFKRNDKPDPTTVAPNSGDTKSDLPSTPVKKRSRFFRSLSAKAVQPPVIREPSSSTPQPPLPAYSSSSSSTESPAPATPDDDSEIGPSASHRRSGQWSERKLALPLPAAGGSLGWDPHQNLSSNPPSIPAIAKSSDSEDVDDDSSTTSSSHSASSPLPVSPPISLHSLTTYALAPTFSAPPLLYLPDVPLFPRSANSTSSLPYRETMVSTLHRTQILRRLARRDLTISEERSITSFTSRRTLPIKSHFHLSKLDNSPVSDVRRVSNVSQGLNQWISRPCFEERMSVYTPGPSGRSDDIVVHNVSGGALGVAALEVSDFIELLAGYNVKEQSESPWLPILSSSSATDLQSPAPGKCHDPFRPESSILTRTQRRPRPPLYPRKQGTSLTKPLHPRCVSRPLLPQISPRRSNQFNLPFTPHSLRYHRLLRYPPMSLLAQNGYDPASDLTWKRRRTRMNMYPSGRSCGSNEGERNEPNS